jgi:membrane protease YdiL (CAAX protease family)
MIGQTAFLIGIPAFFITQKYRVSLRQIGFGWPPRRHYLWLGLKYGVGMMLLSIGLQLALIAILQLLAGPSTTQELKEVTSSLTAEKMLKENRSPAMLAVMLMIASILAPLSEEVFFRGFLYNAAKRRFGIIAGVAISSVVFAAVHFGPLAIIGIIPMGILLAVAYERTGSLWVPIMMHATNNFLAVIGTYLMPDLGI